MGLGTGATAAIVGGIGAAGSVASGLIGANAAGNAASTEANAANNAAALERQSAIDALNFNKLQYGNSLSLLSPFYNSGVAANQRLNYLMGLSPATGLPAGVVNPNASNVPSSTANSGVNSLDLLRANPSNPGTNTGGNPNTITASAFGGQVPRLSSGAPSFSFSPANPSPDALNPNNPSATVTGAPGQVPVNGSATPAGTIVASGTGQVPRIDGGGAPGVNPPDSGPGSFGSLATGWNQTFQSPTNVTEQNDPGYQFRLDQAMKALQNSAAAKGGIFSGGTQKSLTDFAQNDASSEYQNVYNRALQNYNTNYNTFTNDQTNTFNRLMALMGGGQTASNQLSASGLTAANNAANIGLTSAGQIGQQLNNAGAATASGYVGGANAITGAIGNATNSLSTLALLNALNKPGSTQFPPIGAA